MVPFISRNDRFKNPRCSCCDRRIRLLGDQQSLALFLGTKSAQRRAFQCVNCGQVLCNDCSHNGYQCACKCNAWVALPYLEDSTGEAAEEMNASAEQMRPDPNLIIASPGVLKPCEGGGGTFF